MNVCGACQGVVQEKNKATCYSCKQVYHEDCARLPSTGAIRRTRSAKESWVCAECQAKLRLHGGNTNSPAPRQAGDFPRTTFSTPAGSPVSCKSPAVDSEHAILTSQNIAAVASATADERNSSGNTNNKTNINVVPPITLSAEGFSMKDLLYHIDMKVEELSTSYVNKLDEWATRFDMKHADLVASVRSVECRMDNIEEKFASVLDDISALKRKHEMEVNELKRELLNVKLRQDDHEQQSRQCNIEIQGVTERKAENLIGVVLGLCAAIGSPIAESDIVAVHRVPHYNTRQSGGAGVVAAAGVDSGAFAGGSNVDLNATSAAVTSLSVHAATGGNAELPCDVTPSVPDDKLVLVIWYKRGRELPIYSYDIRQGVTSHWSDPTTLGNRATFRTDTDPALLVLNKIRPEDSGQYRCRVDFSQSPTKNAKLNLTVLIPPERLIILNHEGGEVIGSIVGPYDDGTEVNLTCVAVGGRPTARVSWWKSHALLSNSEARATVTFSVSRHELGTEITCQAVTDPSMSPVSKTMSIDVNLRPLWVRLQGGRRPLVASQHTELICQVVGARPKPSISWWKGGARLKTVRETTSLDGNVTTSVLSFIPSIEDAGRVVSCRAVQPTLSHSSQEDGWKMEIQHIPLVKLELGASLDNANIVEGSDVYLDCRVKANPWHHHVYFTHNGVAVRAGVGTLLANQSLVLQGVSRRAAGTYLCAARNALGEGASNKLKLDVKFAPTCRGGQPSVLRAARGDTLDVTCQLDANPSESVTYSWWFNSSAHSRLELTPQPQTNEELQVTGTLSYTINSSSDYGWIQCLGRNIVGAQTKPCVYHILPADKPAALKGCEVTNVTYDSLTMNCTSGHDGGIKQAFLLQVFDTTTGSLLSNVSAESPFFLVRGLTSSGGLALTVRAHNKQGASEPITLTTSLLKYPQRHTGQLPIVVQLTPLLACVAGVTCNLVAVGTAIIIVVKCRHKANRNNGKVEKGKRQQDESSNVRLTDAKQCDSVDSLDKNPDIIPLDGKHGDNCSNKSSTTDYSAIRPLISKVPHDKNEGASHCYTYGRFYETPVDGCNQYIQIRPIDYRVRGQQYGPVFGVQSQGHEGGSQMQSPPYDKVYEDWLKYKNALPLNTTGLLPPEQLLPPDSYMHSLYSQPTRNIHLAKMPDIEQRSGSFQIDPSIDCRSSAQGIGRSFQHERSTSPPVQFSMDGTAYFKKNHYGTSNTLPSRSKQS